MKLIIILLITTTLLIACSTNEEKTEVVTEQNTLTQTTDEEVKDSVNYDLIDLTTLEINKPDTFYRNYLKHFIEKNDTKKVEKIWQFTQQKNIHIAEVYVLYAYYINQNKTKNDEAIALYKEAITLKPNYYIPYKIIGNLYIHYNMLQDALNYLTQAHQIEPKDVEVINNIANIYFVDKQYNMAINFYTKAIATSPNEVVYTNRALCYDNLGKPKLAQQDYAMAESYKQK